MSRTRKVVFHGIFVALLIVSAKVGFTVIPPVPFTLQSAVALLCGLVMGWQSIFTLAIYIALGLIGLPVFAAGGGFAYLFYPTFGFTIGFLFGAFAAGFVYGKHHTVAGSTVAVAVGTLIIYLCGIAYYLLLKNFYFGESVDFWKTILTFYVMFIPSDIIKGALCVLAVKRLKPALNNI